MLNPDCLIQCSFSNWYRKFKNLTFDSVVLELHPDFVNYLVEDKIFARKNVFNAEKTDSSTSSSESSDDDETCHVKQFPELEEKIMETINQFGGEAFVKLNWSSPRDAVWMNYGNTLKCCNYDDVLLLLKSSDFIAHDIKHAHDFCEGDIDTLKNLPKILVLREWKDINMKEEFRCFVKRKQIFGEPKSTNDIFKAISQRRIDSSFPDLQDRQEIIQKQILAFFDENIASAFTLLSYTVDVICDQKGKVTLVDFNVYGEPTESLLFTYDELNDFSRRQFSKDQVVFRLQTNENINLKSTEMNPYKVPIDIINLESLCDESVAEIAPLLNQ